MFYGFVITEAGNSLLASMVAGQTLTITKAVVGEGTADNAEAARKLTNLIDPGPEGTSTVPTVEENSVNMIVEYRSDLNGGLQQGFWIGEFGIFGKVGTGAETLIGYGSLGDAKQYVSAYVSGTAPDVRRYPVSITVTTGIQVDVAYPAEAWMTAEDVADLFNQTLKPELEESLNGLIEDHNEDPDAHQGALKNKQDQIKVEGLLKGSKTTTEEGETYNVGAATPGTDYQAPTNTLTAAESMTTQDLIPFYDATAGQHKRTTLQALKEAIGVQSPTISVTTCTGASVTCSDGAETTLQGTGSTDFELPHVGTWTVTASLGGESVSEQVQVGDVLRVLPGETIPVDGVILSGETSINQAVMTGGSLPVDKGPGDEVSSGTVNQFGAFEMKATKVGEDSSIQRMIRLVQSADAGKAKIVGLADRWATWIVIIALTAAALTWLISGEIIRAVTILVVFCPCALVLATPTAIMAAIGNATKRSESFSKRVDCKIAIHPF